MVKICIPCGVILASGEKLSTTMTLLPPEENSEEAAQRRRRPVKKDMSLKTFAAMLIPGILKPSVLIPSLILIGIASTLIYYGIRLLIWAPRAGILLCWFSILVYCQSVVWLQRGACDILLSKALADYCLVQWVFLVIATLLFLFGSSYIVFAVSF